ncbi:MAG: protein-L-isoaspartate(D-aspartate) O-methyltransferase [Chlorobi bacterium]|nr:protein-L-isoaspartate(D-aspartate) O-methyltransferase [Chlorobiota bacterium]
MNPSEDPFLPQRLALVDVLRRKGITDERVLQAVARVPRHIFAGEENYPYAYEDRPLPVGEGQTISQPFTVAYMTQLLDVEPGTKVLEIGTGSGYQTAILSAMGAKVYTMERIKKLLDRALEKLKQTGFMPEYAAHGDGYAGLPEFAPFDRVIVTAAAPFIPPALTEQLAKGGKMVIPVGTGSQTMYRLLKDSEGRIRKEAYDQFVFVPLLPGKK